MMTVHEMHLVSGSARTFWRAYTAGFIGKGMKEREGNDRGKVLGRRRTGEGGKRKGVSGKGEH